MRDNRKKRIRKQLRRLKKASEGRNESPAFEREELRKERRKKVKQIKEAKLDYHLIKKFKKKKNEALSTEKKLKILKLTKNIVPYGLSKEYVEEVTNTKLIDAYDKIKKSPSTIREKIVPSTPTVKDLDYKRGYIKRYFVQRANDNRAPISEVSAIKFSQVASNAFFKQVKLRWRITGQLEDYKDADGNLKKGVYTSNKRSIGEQLGKMPSLKNRLVNLAEYHIDKRV